MAMHLMDDVGIIGCLVGSTRGDCGVILVVDPDGGLMSGAAKTARSVGRISTSLMQCWSEASPMGGAYVLTAARCAITSWALSGGGSGSGSGSGSIGWGLRTKV